MSRRVLLAAFRREEDLLSAVGAVRAGGGTILDVYSPYAVHGLDEMLGWRPSRLTWACALCGGTGALFMLWFQFWTSAVNWPVNVGGKPYNSLPAFVPVIFEAMVLCGAVGTVLTFFVVSRLRPGKQARLIRPEVTDDRFAILIEQTNAAFDAERMAALLRVHHAEQIEECAIDGHPGRDDESPGDRTVLRRVNAALAVVLTVLILVILCVPRNPLQPNVEFVPTMRRSVPINPQTTVAGLPTGERLPGTLARGAAKMPEFQATAEDAQRAGTELTSPVAPDDQMAIEQGRHVFVNFCASCHGSAGEGDGLIAMRGYPPPPPWSSEKSRSLRDGELFHVITYGRNFMPAHRKQLPAADCWKVVAYIRELQRRAVEQAAQAAQEAAPPPASADSTQSNTTPEPGAVQP